MDTLKSLFVILFFTINALCYAIEIECSVCHEQFDRNKESGTVCPDCKALIKAVKAWKQGCPKCRKYVWLDLCPDCLAWIKEKEEEENECIDRQHELYNVCFNCLKSAYETKYNNDKTTNCLINNCTDTIDPKGCCGYPTGLCITHNKSLMKTIKDHKASCKASCKNYPYLDLCPECLELINTKKAGHEDCIWKGTPYDVYVPCETCLACYACE